MRRGRKESEENAKNADGRSIIAEEPERSRAGSGALAAQSRTLRNSIISLAIFFAIVVALLLGVPGLRAAADSISHADPGWVRRRGLLELLSCLGYVVLFELVFGMLGRRLSSRLSLSELAVNSVVSVSGLAGIALGAWVLRSKGISVGAHRQALGADLRAHERGQPGGGGADRSAHVAGPAAGVPEPAAHAAAGCRGARGDRRNARTGGVGGACGRSTAPGVRPRRRSR